MAVTVGCGRCVTADQDEPEFEPRADEPTNNKTTKLELKPTLSRVRNKISHGSSIKKAHHAASSFRPELHSLTITVNTWIFKVGVITP